MKKFNKKAFAGMMSAAMMLGGTAAPAAAAETPDFSEHVDLTLYLVGDTPENYDEILGAVNEILEEKINTTLNVEWLSWAEHDTKYSLLFSGGEDFDFIFTATSWCHYEQTVGLEGFLELTDELIDTYLPDVKATLPQRAWDQAMLNGGIYMVPANFVEANPESFAYRGDLAEKYGFENGINTWDELIDFYKKCAADGQYGNAMGSTNLFYEWRYQELLAGVGGGPSYGELINYSYEDPENTEIFCLLDNEDFINYCKEMKELADLGAWPKDVLSSKSDRQDTLLNGTGATMFWNAGSCQTYANQANTEHPDWNVQLSCIIPDEPGYTTTKYINGGLGINSSSENIERTLSCINLLCTDEEIQHITSIGIEGKHWERVDEEHYKKLDESFNASNWWGWRNSDYILKLYQENPTLVDEQFNAIDSHALDNVKPDDKLMDFAFDSTPVATQFAAIEAAMGTYWHPLLNGLVDDVDETIADFKSTLESAGLQDVMDEMQSQIESYLESK